jgi:outer membrane receptor protein involved in Fe transport
LNFALQADFNVYAPFQIGVKGEVRNLTNQQQITNGVNLLPNANYGVPLSRGSLNPPRNYQFSAVVKF